MTTAPAYSVSYDFSGYQASNPADPLPGDKLDTELANVATSLNGTQSNVADIRRSDGALKDGIVTVDSLSADAVTQFTAPVTTLANDAAASATSALNSKNAAATSATSAASSATAAAASQADALVSKTSAASSLAALDAVFASFNKAYLGDLASDPTTDLDGGALIEGAQYFNTTTSTLRIFTDSAWEDFTGATAVSNATLSATNAAASETAAASSATAAAASAADAATSETNAAASAAAVSDAVTAFCGMIGKFPGNAAPNSHWLVCDGSLKNRSDEPTLWTYAQASSNIADTDGDWTSGQFSPGDGSTTFRIPKLGGLFVRALDNGAGVDAGRVVGTIQADAFKSHAHDVTDPTHNHTLTDPQHKHNINDPGHVHSYNVFVEGYDAQLSSAGDFAGILAGSNTGRTVTGVTLQNASTGITLAAAATGISVNSQGDTETRPKNVAYIACIHRGV